MEAFFLKVVLGIADRVIKKYIDRFEKMFDIQIEAQMKKQGVIKEQAELLAQLNQADSEEERDAIIKRIQNYSLIIPR